MRIAQTLLASKKGSASSSRWLARARSDPYSVTRGAAPGAPGATSDAGISAPLIARSAHKLVELDDKYHFIKRGLNILDLGASPGGWTQICLQKLKKKGRIIAVDLLDLDARLSNHENLQFIKGDLRDETTLAQLDKAVQQIPRPYLSSDDSVLQPAPANVSEVPLLPAATVDIILSDMLGNTSGNSLRDNQTSLDLCDLVVGISQRYLRSGPQGLLLFKILQSAEADEWRKSKLEKIFNKVSHFKPKSSRKESKEIYMICKDRKV